MTDDANRNSHSSHERVLILASRSWHKTIMAQETAQRPFIKKSFDDILWLRQQPAPVSQLWEDCAMSDPFGEKNGRELRTEMKRSTFFKAKKVLEENDMFRFEQRTKSAKSKEKVWFVTNLHGARVKTYWQDESLAGDCHDSPKSPTGASESLTVDSQSLAGDYEVNETLTLTSSETSEEYNRLKTEDPDVVVSPFVEEDPNSVQLSATDIIELSPDPEVQDPSYLVKPYQPTCREKANLSASMKSSAPAHVESRQNTSHSNEDAPEAPLGVQTSNPTPTTLSELTARFSLAVEGVLFDLDSALAAKGRQKETNELLKLQKTLKSYDEQTILDAVRYVIEKLDSVKSLGAYLTNALRHGYKLTGASVTQQTTKATPEEPKPYRGGLEGFLSESSIDLYNDANFSGWYLQQCDLQLRRDWHKGEAEHRTIICYWRSMQKAGVSPVI